MAIWAKTGTLGWLMPFTKTAAMVRECDATIRDAKIQWFTEPQRLINSCWYAATPPRLGCFTSGTAARPTAPSLPTEKLSDSPQGGWSSG